MAKTEAKAEAAPPPDTLLTQASQIVSAYVSHNQVPAAEIPGLVRSTFTVLQELQSGTSSLIHEGGDKKPAVPIKKSIGDDFLICLEDGKKLTMLKRYLKSQYGLSPEEYRKKWGLPHDYPMVAPAYARLRSDFAKKIGLGKVPEGGVSARKGRKKKGASD